MDVSNKITITIEQKEADNFKTALKKIVRDLDKIGLKNNDILPEEHEVLKKLSDKLK